jgi:ubiquinone/menaquinone biosynthesis C-methylase UbiE
MNKIANSDKQQTATEFFDSWATYQKIITNNYMKHDELFMQFGKLLNSLSEPEQALKLLDLGCGDAFYAAKILSTLPKIEYFGIDSSEQALNAAKKNLIDNQISQASLICGDLATILDEMALTSQKFDIILSSFCLHHYQESEKLIIYQKIKQVLAENGRFIMIDLFREETQSRHDYLSTTMEKFYSNLPALAQSEISNLREHVESSDYPQTYSETQEAITSLGFKNMECCFSIDHYALYCAR